MFFFKTTNKKRQCYPSCFFSRRPIKNDSVTLRYCTHKTNEAFCVGVAVQCCTPPGCCSCSETSVGSSRSGHRGGVRTRLLERFDHDTWCCCHLVCEGWSNLCSLITATGEAASTSPRVQSDQARRGCFNQSSSTAAPQLVDLIEKERNLMIISSVRVTSD